MTQHHPASSSLRWDQPWGSKRPKATAALQRYLARSLPSLTPLGLLPCSIVALPCFWERISAEGLSLTPNKSVRIVSLSSWPTLCNPMYCTCQDPLSMEFSKQDTRVGCHLLFQGIFPTHRLNPGLLHCRQIGYLLSHQGSPKICCSGFHIKLVVCQRHLVVTLSISLLQYVTVICCCFLKMV